jgi:hypothetical protein
MGAIFMKFGRAPAIRARLARGWCVWFVRLDTGSAY